MPSPDDAADTPALLKKDSALPISDATTLDDLADGSLPSPFQLAVAPNRMLDLIFMIDNSPSMALKQAKLQSQFPRLLDALKDPSDGSLPDLRIALIDSDLGSGAAYSNGSCGPKTLSDGSSSAYGDLGRFQTIGAQACGLTDASALWLENNKGLGVNYTGDIGTVFSCLATNLGTLGCGLEHSLQAFEFALASFVFNPWGLLSVAAIGNGIYVLRSLKESDTAQRIAAKAEKARVGAMAGIVLGAISGLLFVLSFLTKILG